MEKIKERKGKERVKKKGKERKRKVKKKEH